MLYSVQLLIRLHLGEYTGSKTFSLLQLLNTIWICLVTSILMFNIIPIIAKIIKINIIYKIVIGIICILLMYKNSPADTYKRPLVNKRKRIQLKYLSTLACIIYYGFSITEIAKMDISNSGNNMDARLFSSC